MRAELIEEENLLARHAGIGQIFQQPRNKPFIGRGPGQIRESDADAVALLDPLAQGLRADGRSQRRSHRVLFIRQAGPMRRLDHRRAVLRQIDGQMPWP